MNQWIQLGLEKDGIRVSCLLDDSFSMLPLSPLDRDIIIDITRPVSERFYLTSLEALNFACALPEIKALIKWALDVRETMSEADLFAHGVEELKPFIGREAE